MGHGNDMLRLHDWLTGEIGLAWEPANGRWVHAGLAVEVKASVARALEDQGRLAEIRPLVVRALRRKAAAMGVRGIPGVVDPFPEPAHTGR